MARGRVASPRREPAAHAAAEPAAPVEAWTLIWVSDVAFKSSGAQVKEQLGALGGQVKCYKAHRNVIRALDKKRSALVRTVFFLEAAEAEPVVAYLRGRPDLAARHVVAEAPEEGPPRPAEEGEAPTCRRVPSFQEALQVLQQITTDPAFT